FNLSPTAFPVFGSFSTAGCCNGPGGQFITTFGSYNVTQGGSQTQTSFDAFGGSGTVTVNYSATPSPSISVDVSVIPVEVIPGTFGTFSAASGQMNYSYFLRVEGPSPGTALVDIDAGSGFTGDGFGALSVGVFGGTTFALNACSNGTCPQLL